MYAYAIGAGVYNDWNLGAAFAGGAKWATPVLPFTCPTYNSIAGEPTMRQAARHKGPRPYSVDCDLLTVGRSKNNKAVGAPSTNESSYLAFVYTMTPQRGPELTLLSALSTTPRGAPHYRSAQDDTDVIVLQVPSGDGVYEPSKDMPSLAEVLDAIAAVQVGFFFIPSCNIFEPG